MRLPDALWRRLHPVRQVRPWFIRFRERKEVLQVAQEQAAEHQRVGEETDVRLAPLAKRLWSCAIGMLLTLGAVTALGVQDVVSAGASWDPRWVLRAGVALLSLGLFSAGYSALLRIRATIDDSRQARRGAAAWLLAACPLLGVSQLSGELRKLKTYETYTYRSRWRPARAGKLLVWLYHGTWTLLGLGALRSLL